MNLTLERSIFGLYGIFGELVSEDGKFKCFTLEHAYETSKGVYTPKVAAGSYSCIRGMHRLKTSREPFPTFSLKNVPPFQERNVTGILFHAGNYNKDSEGCILLGEHIQAGCLINSRKTFACFMEIQEGVESFDLLIKHTQGG